MTPITSIRHLVSFWAGPSDFAVAVSTPDDPTPTNRVYRWMRMDRIPAKYFQRVLNAAEDRGVVLTDADLVRLHAKESRNAADK